MRYPVPAAKALIISSLFLLLAGCMHVSSKLAIPATSINRVDDCVRANVLHGIHQLQTQSIVIAEKIEKKELQVIGARYDLDNYKVDIIEQ